MTPHAPQQSEELAAGPQPVDRRAGKAKRVQRGVSLRGGSRLRPHATKNRRAHCAGKQKSGKINPQVWKRYRNTCAGVEAQLRAGKQFQWGQ